MALPLEFMVAARRAAKSDAWILPMTAAVVVGGAVLFWSVAGLFWLAARPAQPQIVIRVVSSETQPSVSYHVEGDTSRIAREVSP